MAFIGLNELLNWLSGVWPPFPAGTAILYLYPVKTLVVASILYHYRKEYREILRQELADRKSASLAIGAGIIVFILWINMDWPFATFGTPSAYNPTLMSEKFTAVMLIIFRLAGAAIVVPIMEELFWRSFLLRYIIDPDFEKVAIGTFTWPSFAISSVLFGLEHNLWLAGIMAGLAYNILLYRTRSLMTCIVAHSTTNFLLGTYVLCCGAWEFW
jgi:hypothetical protein